MEANIFNFEVKYIKRKGFTLIEVAIVMVILGLIMGLGMPMMSMLMKSNKLHEDRNTVEQAKDALIGYAFAHGGFPSPTNSKNGLKTLPYDILGVRQTDANGNPLIYYVNENLKEDNISNHNYSNDNSSKAEEFCRKVQKVKKEYPKIRYYKDGVNSVAFVVVSKGLNYRLDNLNAKAAKSSIKQAIFCAPSWPYSKNYDDIVDSVSFGYLNGLCAKNGLLDNSSQSGNQSWPPWPPGHTWPPGNSGNGGSGNNGNNGNNK